MKKDNRFGHSEGTTDIALTEDGKLLTCGSDGDIRIWNGFSDDDPASFSASDSCLCLLCFGENVFVGTENHTVEAYELPHGKKLGVKAKFSAAVNHMDVSKDRTFLVAGSGDSTIQIVKLDSSTSQPIKLEAHSAPVLSVAIDPIQKYFASSGCDGNVNVWLLNSDLKLPTIAKSWENAFPKSTDIALTPTFCRMHWSPDGGDILAIPEMTKVGLYTRDNWTRKQVLQCKDITKLISVVRFSICGKYIAGGCSNGLIVMWNTGTSELIMKHTFASNAITGLLSTSGPEIYAVDAKGRFHWIGEILNLNSENNKLSTASTPKPNSPREVENDDGMFDDGMDDIFGDTGEDDENEISILKIKAEVGFINDEYVGVDRATQGKKTSDEDDDVVSVASADGSNSVHSTRVSTLNSFTKAQEPFQPTSTPTQLEHRFMVWNNVGTIRSYSTEDDDAAIDVEFHDPSHHQAVHLRNQFDYSMGTLSLDAIVFACEKGKDYPSKLFCLNYVSWDVSKEWAIDMPQEEEILAIGIGASWIVVATNLNRLRLYSLSGLQYFVYDTPGQVVSLSGYNNLLFFTYHSGVGANGNQSIFYSIFIVKSYALSPLIMHSPLPLTPESTLAWVGFTEEGTPAFSDSSNTLRILNGRLWTPICNMKEFLSGPNDHFWVLGLSQLAQNVRAVKCKGAKYPPTLPRPTQMILDAKIPLCELDNEKGQQEDIMLRSFMTKAIAKKMDSKGFDTEEYKRSAKAALASSLIQLFYLSVAGNRDYRSSEYISLMPSSAAVQVAIKHAHTHHKRALVQHLTTIGQKKMEFVESEEEDDFETQGFPVASTNSYSNDSMVGSLFGIRNESVSGVPGMYQDVDYTSESRGNSRVTDLEPLVENPLLKKQKEEIRNIICPQEVRNANPFKKTEIEKIDSQGSTKGLAYIEAWRKPAEKSNELEFNPKHSKSKRSIAKKSLDKPKNTAAIGKESGKKKGKKQATLFDLHGRNNGSKISNSNPDSPALLNEDSNPNTMNILSESMQNEEHGETEDTNLDETSRIKRKRVDEDNNGETEKRSKFASKLAIFTKTTTDNSSDRLT